MLFAADVYEKLLIDKIGPLSSGLLAIEICLGCTLMGKTNKFKTVESTSVVLSFHGVEAQISDLWRFDTMGILDPGLKAIREELAKSAEEHISCKIRIVEDERYEVSLPWLNRLSAAKSYRAVSASLV